MGHEYEAVRDLAAHRGAALVHARRRALERYGVEPRPAEVSAHEEAIRSGASVHLGTAMSFDGIGASKEIHAVPGGSRPWFAVYDLRIERIVTYLGAVEHWSEHLTQSGVDLVLEPGMLDGLAYGPSDAA